MAAKKLTTWSVKKVLACDEITFQTRRFLGVWTKHKIVKSPHQDVHIPRRTIPEHIWENLEKWTDKTAVVCGITNRSYTYHQLYKNSRNFAVNLRSQLKIKDGDAVCIMMANSPEYPLALLGALEAGAVTSTFNPTFTPHEIVKQIELCQPRVLIGQPETVPILKEALSLIKQNLPIITVTSSHPQSSLPPGTISFEELALTDNVDYSCLTEVSRTADDVALLPFSSGTTGLPKGVELLHKNVIANFIQQDVDTARHYTDTTKTNQDSNLAVLPFFHIYGLSIVLLHKLAAGLKIVTVPKFQPNTFIDVLTQHPINILYLAPPTILFLGSHSSVTKEHLAPLKILATGAAPISKTDIDQVLSKLQSTSNFLNIYGMTEAAPLITGTLPGSTNYSTVGPGLSNTELRIVDSELRPLGINEIGELLIRGPQVMNGYKNSPEATKHTITEDGWLRSGDLASIDKDGTVTIADRLKELIKVKGYQVPPAELESVLKEHPDVFDVAVLGIPHKVTGEVPKAFIVPKEGRELNAKAIQSFVDKRVAKYKRIEEIIFIDVIPKSPSGKILKRILKDKFC